MSNIRGLSSIGGPGGSAIAGAGSTAAWLQQKKERDEKRREKELQVEQEIAQRKLEREKKDAEKKEQERKVAAPVTPLKGAVATTDKPASPSLDKIQKLREEQKLKEAQDREQLRLEKEAAAKALQTKQSADLQNLAQRKAEEDAKKAADKQAKDRERLEKLEKMRKEKDEIARKLAEDNQIELEKLKQAKEGWVNKYSAVAEKETEKEKALQQQLEKQNREIDQMKRGHETQIKQLEEENKKWMDKVEKETVRQKELSKAEKKALLTVLENIKGKLDKLSPEQKTSFGLSDDDFEFKDSGAGGGAAAKPDDDFVPVSGGPPPPGSGGPPPPPPPSGGPPPPPPPGGGPPPPPPPPGGGPPPPPPPPGGGPPPPPPPPGGGPPGPPPPPGKMGGPPPPMPGKGKLGGKAAPTKPEVKPNVTMKQLFWDRILLGTKESRQNQPPMIWDSVQEASLDVPDFERHFGAAQKKKEEDKPEAVKKTLSVLDGKRSNAIAIMMSKLPDLDQLVSGIEGLDDQKLTLDNIEALIDNLPTGEELESIQAAQKDAKNASIPLDKPEKFAVTVTKVPRVAERLKCWLFMKMFEERKKDIFVPLARIKSACYQLKIYEPMKTILGIILVSGNYLNAGTARGQADGFLLTVLIKLADTKSTADKNTTLLTFVVRHLYQQKPTLMSMGTLPDLTEASKIPFAEVEAAINQLRVGINETKNLCAKVMEESKGKDKRFADVIPTFMADAERTHGHLEVLFKESCALFMDTLLYFGWPEAKAKTVTNDKFFGELGQFMEGFTSLWKVEEAVEERKKFEQAMEKKARLEALSGERKKEKASGDKGQSKEGSSVPPATTAPDSQKAKLKNKFRDKK